VASAPNLNTSVESSENKKRILILEDDIDLLELLQDAFRMYGFEVDAYTDSEAAVNAFVHLNASYDLIIMDLKLDGIDGRSIYKKFKEFDSAFKICILTGLEVDVPAFKEICPSFEEKFLIKKPVKITALMETIKSILGS
jgi:DNA-binding response OmpR family regulator